jgi:hypothetical protein
MPAREVDREVEMRAADGITIIVVRHMEWCRACGRVDRDNHRSGRCVCCEDSILDILARADRRASDGRV